MTIIKQHPAGLCSAAQLDDFEGQARIRLPDTYRRWLLQNNGGRPDPKRIEFIENGIPTASDVHWIYGLGKPDWADLSDAFITFKARIPKGLIPVARDSGGNQYLIESPSGRILFWNHEVEDLEVSKMPVCANSFEEFLANLKARED